MGKIFNHENENGFLSFLSLAGDLILLNLLTILGSLPILTMGTSITAAHFTALKLHRGEGQLFSTFFRSYKENLKQTVPVWCLFLVYVVLSYNTFVSLSEGTDAVIPILRGCVLASVVFCIFVLLWYFPMQAKFYNPIKKTLKNAFFLTFRHLFRTLLMLALTILPFLVNMYTFWLDLLYGFSLPIYLSAMCYDKVIAKLEDQVYAQTAEKATEVETT